LLVLCINFIEVTLAIRLSRSTFDFILSQSIHSAYLPELYASEDHWQQTVQNSDVRLQWDPDHSPSGEKLSRRAIQLRLQRTAARQYSRDWILEIQDISEFVAEQRQYAIAQNYKSLLIPKEHPYPVPDPETAKKLQLS
jgi:Domain of unknown function (DUF4291)